MGLKNFRFCNLILVDDLPRSFVRKCRIAYIEVNVSNLRMDGKHFDVNLDWSQENLHFVQTSHYTGTNSTKLANHKEERRLSQSAESSKGTMESYN